MCLYYMFHGFSWHQYQYNGRQARSNGKLLLALPIPPKAPHILLLVIFPQKIHCLIQKLPLFLIHRVHCRTVETLPPGRGFRG